MRSNSKRIDGNRREGRSDGDLVQAPTLFSCEHEDHDHRSSRTLSTADKCFAVVPMCQEWRPNARLGETELEDAFEKVGVRPQTILSAGAHVFLTSQ